MNAKEELVFATVASVICAAIIFAVTHRAGLAAFDGALFALGSWLGWRIYQVQQNRKARKAMLQLLAEISGDRR